MKQTINSRLQALREGGNYRRIPAPAPSATSNVDFTGNDYLGIGTDGELRAEFMNLYGNEALTSSASRLLARRQDAYASFENFLEELYGFGRKALIFNSGYHANTGIVSSLAGKGTVIVADRLVHASIIDGIRLSGAPFERFRHNDFNHARRLVQKAAEAGNKVLLIAETVYSMDGDSPDLDAIKGIKDDFREVTVFLDEAHAVGVTGPHGLGVCADKPWVDVMVGTLGKAYASCGAYAITSPEIREYLVNTARSFIFSTALPPLNVRWSEFVVRHSLNMDAERKHLTHLGSVLAAELGRESGSHIQPFIVGDPHRAVALSQAIAGEGFDVLPIRTPTVPPGTDRLRISLNATIGEDCVRALAKAIKKNYHNE